MRGLNGITHLRVFVTCRVKVYLKVTNNFFKDLFNNTQLILASICFVFQQFKMLFILETKKKKKKKKRKKERKNIE